MKALWASLWRCRLHNQQDISGPEKGVATKGVFSLEESLESLNSLVSLENGLLWKDPFSKRPLFQKTPFSEPEYQSSRKHTRTHTHVRTHTHTKWSELGIIESPGCAAASLSGPLSRHGPHQCQVANMVVPSQCVVIFYSRCHTVWVGLAMSWYDHNFLWVYSKWGSAWVGDLQLEGKLASEHAQGNLLGQRACSVALPPGSDLSPSVALRFLLVGCCLPKSAQWSCPLHSQCLYSSSGNCWDKGTKQL